LRLKRLPETAGAFVLERLSHFRPAQAGHPVITGVSHLIAALPLLDCPLARAMTAE
jgi:hypothetical protein